MDLADSSSHPTPQLLYCLPLQPVTFFLYLTTFTHLLPVAFTLRLINRFGTSPLTLVSPLSRLPNFILHRIICDLTASTFSSLAIRFTRDMTARCQCPACRSLATGIPPEGSRVDAAFLLSLETLVSSDLREDGFHGQLWKSVFCHLSGWNPVTGEPKKAWTVPRLGCSYEISKETVTTSEVLRRWFGLDIFVQHPYVSTSSAESGVPDPARSGKAYLCLPSQIVPKNLDVVRLGEEYFRVEAGSKCRFVRLVDMMGVEVVKYRGEEAVGFSYEGEEWGDGKEAGHLEMFRQGMGTTEGLECLGLGWRLFSGL
ncbi:hypothetical protein RUND412_009295 [Rhizina undulata]